MTDGKRIFLGFGFISLNTALKNLPDQSFNLLILVSGQKMPVSKVGIKFFPKGFEFFRVSWAGSTLKETISTFSPSFSADPGLFSY